MSSSQPTYLRFDQDEYDADFFECDIGHPLIAFVTCWCPMCETKGELAESIKELDSVETQLDEKIDSYQRLIVAVTKHSPELLI